MRLLGRRRPANALRADLARFIRLALEPPPQRVPPRFVYRLPVRQSVLERCRVSLLQLAALLADCSVTVSPETLAATNQFLTNACDSSLYGDHELRALHAVHGLIGRIEAEARTAA
jgi:hypothetical protein